MKNNYILSYNLNGWCPVNRKLSYDQKIRSFASYVFKFYEKPICIMIQEIIAGRDQKYLKLIESLFKDYEVILPFFDYDKHNRSIMSVTLIKKDVLKGYSRRDFDVELPNRINYVIANIDNEEYHLINTHVVQTVNFKNKAAWFIEERKRLYKYQWELLISKAKETNDCNVIIAGDFQEPFHESHLIELERLGYKGPQLNNTNTVENSFFGDNTCIDHIIFSASAYKKHMPVILVDSNKVGLWSDHSLIYAKCL